MSARLRVNVAIVDQSNGNGQHSTIQKSTWGPYHEDPIPPNGTSAKGSWWPRLTSRMAYERNVYMRLDNTSRGGTNILEDWTGYSGTIGGSAVALTSSDGGWDPNGYVQAVADAIARDNDPSFRLVIFSGPGQAEHVVGSTPAEFQAGLLSMGRYLLEQSSDVHISMGYTIWRRPIPAADQILYQERGDAAWRAAVILAGEYPGRVVEGARGIDVWTYADTPLQDTVHLADSGHDTMADAIYDKLVRSGWF